MTSTVRISEEKFGLVIVFNAVTLSECSHAQLQENIDSDKEKAARIHSQNHDLQKKIEEIRGRIRAFESSLKDLRSLQSQITTKRAMKDMLTQRRVKQYDELAEENDG